MVVKVAPQARTMRTLLGNHEVSQATKPTREYIKQGFRAVLHGISLDAFAALLTDDFRDFTEYLELLGNGKTCQRMSLRYNPHRLSTQASRYANGPTLYKAITTGMGMAKNPKPDSFYDGLARVYLAREKEHAQQNLLYTLIQWGVQGTYYTNEFPPHVARDIYRYFGMGPDSRILDPCAGWGGRMIGASTVSKTYRGYEPATQTHTGLLLLARRLSELSGGTFDASVQCKPFEESRLRPNSFDIALTSPPYYDTEIYSDEETNSLNRYKTFEDWCAGFYLPFIDKTLAALKPGAPFILNIGDRRYPLTQTLYDHCDAIGAKHDLLPTRLTGGSSMAKLANPTGARLASGGGLRSKKTSGEIFCVVSKYD